MPTLEELQTMSQHIEYAIQQLQYAAQAMDTVVSVGQTYGASAQGMQEAHQAVTDIMDLLNRAQTNYYAVQGDINVQMQQAQQNGGSGDGSDGSSSSDSGDGSDSSDNPYQ